ncbi:hypothetical protein [Muricoccus pecuniae]|uniref:Uncharacterized protein n=1 Tax=Muricoccus pecuniae TaxID=693023 RepID=A0A840Y887_9PROT|nr:hypothetical protein [Roseomonas pecuniae]MBB5694969.1 hypothetical protein [Roseomonas pecuniae]
MSVTHPLRNPSVFGPPSRTQALPGPRYRIAETDSTNLSFRLSCLLILSGTVLQKIAIPGTGGTETAIPISTPMLLLTVVLLLLRGKLVVDGWRLTFFLMFLTSTIVSFLASDSIRLSTTSWMYLVVIQSAFVFRYTKGSFDFERLLRFTANFAFVAALLGLAQFFSQFVVGRSLAFPIENFAPATILLPGFNYIIPIVWDSPILKSNGYFFAEPSFFCQFLAIGLIVELLRGLRLLRLGVIAAGILCSYSGTGMMTLALFLPWYIISRKRYELVVIGLIGLAVVLAFGPSLHLSAITNRVSEFSSQDSSAFGRFLSIFFVLGQFIITDLWTVLFGRGPGTVMEYFNRLSYGAFDPTWGKIAYEYGLVGFVLYFTYFTRSFVLARPELRVPLGFTYLFLGGYLVNSSVVLQLLVLVSWPETHKPEPQPAVPAGHDTGNRLPRGTGMGMGALRHHRA